MPSGTIINVMRASHPLHKCGGYTHIRMKWKSFILDFDWWNAKWRFSLCIVAFNCTFLCKTPSFVMASFLKVAVLPTTTLSSPFNIFDLTATRSSTLLIGSLQSSVVISCDQSLIVNLITMKKGSIHQGILPGSFPHVVNFSRT